MFSDIKGVGDGGWWVHGCCLHHGNLPPKSYLCDPQVVTFCTGLCVNKMARLRGVGGGWVKTEFQPSGREVPPVACT